MILRDLPWRMLAVLKITGKVRWEGYRISHVPHKLFTVSKNGVAATIYDCFGYFHCRYTTALEKYGIGSGSDREIIQHGKRHRGTFTYADLPEVTTYWRTEIGLLPDLMDRIRDAAYAGGFHIASWHGPGALANYALRYNGVSRYHSRNLPSYVRTASRAAYCGGRFQAWMCGEYDGPVWTLDKNSAYVQAIAMLPRLDNGKWRRIDVSTIHGSGDIARFGLYHIVYNHHDNGRKRRAHGYPESPNPLFHRDKNGKLTWPSVVDGWFWSPEAMLVAGNDDARFVEAIVYQDDGTYPFRWVEDAYATRLRLQDPDHYSPAEKAYKWALAAIYGAFARRVGWDRKRRTAPRTHELLWAGFITSHCRAAIYPVARYAYDQEALISVDTDGVMATCPFPENLVPEGFGNGLGQWKQERFSGLLYWQNGIYWLRNDDGEWKDAKSRGIPKGVIPREAALHAMATASFTPPYKPAKIKTTRTRFVGYRQALNAQHRNWRVWKTEPNEIVFGGTGKGLHAPPFCHVCRGGTRMKMHTITHLPPREAVSYPHKLPWLEEVPDDMEIGVIVTRDFIQAETDIWGDDDLEDNL
ncbi:MAG TPA: hypothetical protein VNB49_10590 [Candidatus Dormibacteraeota bacterium]|nr:hypothetical protein [Candidatus Dormibacteraeota bacterium]